MRERANSVYFVHLRLIFFFRDKTWNSITRVNNEWLCCLFNERLIKSQTPFVVRWLICKARYNNRNMIILWRINIFTRNSCNLVLPTYNCNMFQDLRWYPKSPAPITGSRWVLYRFGSPRSGNQHVPNTTSRREIQSLSLFLFAVWLHLGSPQFSGKSRFLLCVRNKSDI